MSIRLDRPYVFPLILSLGLLIRLVYGLSLGTALLSGDGGYYFIDAHKVLEGNLTTPYWPPGMLYLLAGGIGLMGYQVYTALVIMLLVFVLGSWVMQHFLRMWLSLRTTNLLQGLFMIYPAFIHHQTAPLSQYPLAICLMVAALILWKHVERPVLRALALGLILALALLFRPASLFCLPLFLYLGHQQMRWKIAWATIPLILLIGAWQLQATKLAGYPVWINTANSLNIYLGNHPQTPLYHTWWLGSKDVSEDPRFQEFRRDWQEIKALNAADQGAAYRRAALGHMLDRPDLFLLRSLNRVRTFWAFDTYTAGSLRSQYPLASKLALMLDILCFGSIGFLAIVGFFEKFRHRAVVILLVLVFMLPYILAFSHPTYHLPLMPWLAIAAGLAWERSGKISWAKRGLRWLIVLFMYIQLEWLLMRLIM